MADLESSSDSTVPPLSKTPAPLTKSPSKPVRRVAFSEIPPKHHCLPKHHCMPSNEDSKNCGSCCLVFFAWMCLGIFALSLFVFLIGVLFLSFLRADLPDVYIENLSFTKFRVTNKTNSSLMDMDVGLRINVSNQNEKFELSFGSLKVDVFSEGIKLGEAKVPGFSQSPKNEIALMPNITAKQIAVDKEVAEEFQSNKENVQMVVDVYLTGNIGIHLAGFKIVGMPLRVSCEKIEQLKVINGERAKCLARIFGPR